MHKIDILLATYNGEKYLAEQLDSILNQSYQDFMILIHDDNSTDGTIGIINKYQRNYPEKIKYLDDNISTGSAKNNFEFLLNESRAQYIMFSDQDDFWLPNKIELSIEKMINTENSNKNTPVLIYSDLCIVDENLNIIHNSMFDLNFQEYKKNSLYKLMLGNYITGNTILINSISKKHILPIPDDAIMHDWWIGLNIMKVGIIDSIDNQLTLYRQHEYNVCGVNIKKEGFIRKIFKIKKLISKNINILKMLDKLPFEINYIKYYHYKLLFIIYKAKYDKKY